MKYAFSFLLFVLLIQGCHQNNDDEGLTWLNLSHSEKFKNIEKQFRGLDQTMVEVGYRYNELYWAGEDQNWELATYQLEKIGLTIELGLQRRPKRKASAVVIFPVLERLKSIAKDKNQQRFREEFKILQQTCIQCHQAEKVPFFKVAIPKLRLSPLEN